VQHGLWDGRRRISEEAMRFDKRKSLELFGFFADFTLQTAVFLVLAWR
jgi:hypothetical protein